MEDGYLKLARQRVFKLVRNLVALIDLKLAEPGFDADLVGLPKQKRVACDGIEQRYHE